MYEMVFDQDGNAVTSEMHSAEELPKYSYDCADVGVRYCPNCGTMYVVPEDVMSDKVKEHKCFKCGEVVGEW